MSRIGILGSGRVGQTLAEGLKRKQHQVRIASRTPDKLSDFTAETDIENGTFAEVAAWGDQLILCVKGTGALDALKAAGAQYLSGKVVIDTTNPIANEPPEDGVLRYFTGPNTSLMEQLQSAFPESHFVKAFNSVGNDLMIDPDFGQTRPTMFYCGNDAASKAAVAQILTQVGWEPMDMGGAKAARAIEPLCQLWCIPGIRNNDWGKRAFHMLHKR